MTLGLANGPSWGGASIARYRFDIEKEKRTVGQSENVGFAQPLQGSGWTFLDRILTYFNRAIISPLIPRVRDYAHSLSPLGP